MGPPATLQIDESRTDTGVRLTLSGELDLASSAMLEDRLVHLRVTKAPVRLNLARLEFIDSTGIHLLIRTVGEARIKGWQLEIEPDIHPQVMRMFKLVHLDRLVMDGQPVADADGATASASAQAPDADGATASASAQAPQPATPPKAPAPAKPPGG